MIHAAIAAILSIVVIILRRQSLASLPCPDAGKPIRTFKACPNRQAFFTCPCRIDRIR